MRPLTYRVEALIEGQWIPIYSSHRRDWVERALAVYGRIVMWPVRFVDAPLAKEAGE